ncbi:hypothetical protein NPIL_9931 [Nephila pilipes]|uniref:Uncharacterized protein n=1 Tax=Nephila pilipes TaxID=299642 RepID=A0A8X6QIQ2_NEPPI|nr:hypothetical protein NPIL_9931 [Nephila pilipes]
MTIYAKQKRLFSRWILEYSMSPSRGEGLCGALKNTCQVNGESKSSRQETQHTKTGHSTRNQGGRHFEKRKQMTRPGRREKIQGARIIERLPNRRSLLRGSRGRERRDSKETGETIHNQQGIRQGT